jgi:3'-5' exonuclease
MPGSGKLKKLIKDPNSQSLVIFLLRLQKAGLWPDKKEDMDRLRRELMPGSAMPTSKELRARLRDLGFLTPGGTPFNWNKGLVHDLSRNAPENVKAAAATLTQQQQPHKLVSQPALQPSPAIVTSSQVFTCTGQKDFDLANGTKCCVVDTAVKLQTVIASDVQLMAKGNARDQSTQFVAVDCEGVPEALELLQVATRTAIYVFDGRALGAEALCTALKPLFDSEIIVKVMHDLRQDVRALNDLGKVRLTNILDSQLVAEHLFGDFSLGFNACLKRLEMAEHPSKEFVHGKMKSDNDYWSRRPLRKTDIEYAALDASLLLAMVPKFTDLLSGDNNDLANLLAASHERMNVSVAHGGARCFCFDRSRDYSMSSPELMRAFSSQTTVFGMPLVVQSEMSEVLRVLPEEFRAKFLTPGSTPQIDIECVSDINIDRGSRPQCWVKGKRVFLIDDEERQVVEEDVMQIVSELGDIGSDNRAGLDGQLHRFSVMKARDETIAGVTIRLGRWITGNADILIDLLLASEKSILFLGEPGSGACHFERILHVTTSNRSQRPCLHIIMSPRQGKPRWCEKQFEF